jgi:hypothetical protein
MVFIIILDAVKVLIANEGGLQLVCTRLEQLISKQDAGDLNADDAEVEAVVKKACDLIIIVLTGGKWSIHIIFNNCVLSLLVF